MAAQGVNDKIAKVEKKMNSPTPPTKETPFMPPIQGQKMNVPIINNFDAPKGRVHPPQSAKPTGNKEPPQSARVI